MGTFASLTLSKLGSMGLKPHALCIPAPGQGHINPLLKLAKVLHSKGFTITFVNTDYNHQRLLKTLGSDALHGVPTFHFHSIPDGLPPTENTEVTQDIAVIVKSLHETGLGPLKSLVAKLDASGEPVTCLVADFIMGYTLPVAHELGIPDIIFWTAGAGSLICYDKFSELIKKGLMPLKDRSYLVNGYLDTEIDFIPSMHGIRLKDIPPFVRVVNPGDEFMVKFQHISKDSALTSTAMIFNTFHELEPDILDTLSTIFPPCIPIGPLHLLENTIVDKSLASIKSNLWKEESECLKWLDSKSQSSVIYVNFGSVTVMTPQQLVEFCWGLAKSNCSFLWIIRPDLVIGNSAVLPTEFLAETKNRGLLASWCPQEEVLSHPSIGGFLTHSGWNSTIESISNAVPMLCWPFFADQQTNSWCCFKKWGVAMEINNDAKSDEVAKLVSELMNEEKGKKLKAKAIDWKNKAEKACETPFGSSIVNLEKLIGILQKSLK